ncbi:hypothetical protein GGQ85_001666 [Nitrobacter vulgaris]|nr:hypothetical protein [Nitrobacter vulgaris]
MLPVSGPQSPSAGSRFAGAQFISENGGGAGVRLRKR